MKTYLTVVLSLLGLCTGFCMAAQKVTDGLTVEVMEIPAIGAKNSHYVSNRQPLLTNPLIKLPIGNIDPKGWLKNQLVLLREGMVGNIEELSRWVSSDNSAWLSEQDEKRSVQSRGV
jgi:hypothetical protein